MSATLSRLDHLLDEIAPGAPLGVTWRLAIQRRPDWVLSKLVDPDYPMRFDLLHAVWDAWNDRRRWVLGQAVQG